jgi:hypothetical protein
MQLGSLLLTTAIFLGSSVVAIARQASFGHDSSQAGNQASADTPRECSNPNLQRAASQIVERNQSAQVGQSGPDGSLATDAGATPAAVDFEQDLKLLGERQTQLAQCILANDTQVSEQDPAGACFGELAVKFEMRHDGEPERDIPVGRLQGTTAFFYESSMTIDADGAPNAYHPDNVGLDDLANAGGPGNWPGLAKDANGDPLIQGPDDPFPGYYISTTALADRSKPANDPTRYVDASKIPFVVLPGAMARGLGARPGDFAVVFNQQNGKSSYAIFGDIGPPDRIGEGSVALAENLGIRSNARNGGARRGILYLVFPGSGNGRPRTIEEINAEGEKLLAAWEGSILRTACTRVQAPVGAHGSNERSAGALDGTQGAN